MRQKVFFVLSSVNSARGQQMDSCLLVTAGVLTLSSSSFVETQSLLQRTIVPECLMHHCSFRAFCCNPFSSFVLWLLFLYSVCVSVWAWLCVLVWYISFLRSYYIQWICLIIALWGILIIHSAYSPSPPTTCRGVCVCEVGGNEPGLCCTSPYLRDLYSPRLSLSHHALKSRRFITRIWGALEDFCHC